MGTSLIEGLSGLLFRKWLRFSDKGGIGKAVSLADRLAESGTDELMFMEGDPIVVLMQLGQSYLFVFHCSSSRVWVFGCAI